MDINGHGRHAYVSSMDFYRHLPRDLTEATTLGVVMSICTLLVMTVLFVSETWAFVRWNVATSIAPDANNEEQIRLNFNVTLMDLHCDYVSVDVWDTLGTNLQNVTKNVEKWQLDENGVRRMYSGRNREMREVAHEEHEESLEELHKDGVYAVDLDDKTFPEFIKEHEMAFIDLFAPWCVWCQRLHPTWEKFAREVEEEEMPVGVAKVDCVQNAQLCKDEKVMAFPTLRWYSSGKETKPDYKMDRTVAALMDFAKHKLEMEEKFKDWEKNRPDANERKEEHRDRRLGPPEHPGCQVSGHLMVNRVPGNFHIEAKSKNHNINAAMTNLTHRVNHLSFGDPTLTESIRRKRLVEQIPGGSDQFAPMDGKLFVTKEFHQVFHHYIKIVSTHLDAGGRNAFVTVYQFLEQSQLVHYDEVNVPEARFSYDLSPMGVVIKKEGRKWYDYLTSLCAIIGGTFTTLGLINAILLKFFKPKKL